MTAIHIRPDVIDLIREIPDAPTDPERNAAFRATIVDMGSNDSLWAEAINHRCAGDPVFYMNTFGWTQNPKDFPDNPHQPIILFPRQEQYIRKLDFNVENGRPLLLEKSREQLASVGTSTYCLWRWRYKTNANIKVGSMKEELVDGDSYADQIFPKIDYTIERQPEWLMATGYNPKKGSPTRKHMVYVNPMSGMVMKGEATNKHFSVSGRYAMVWLDEFAKVEHQQSIHRKVANTTNCFVYTTTPEGYEMFAEMVRSKVYDVFRLHWTHNGLWLPKGYDFRQCDWDNKVWPSEWICAPGCRVHPNGGWPHSERYDKECEKYGYDEQDIAQELDIDYLKSGSSVFDQDRIAKCMVFIENKEPQYQHYRLDFVVPQGERPVPGAELDDWFTAASNWKVEATPIHSGPFKILTGKEPGSCRDTNCLCHGTGYHTYAVGGDTARNVDKDWDCLWVIDLTLGEVVGTWHGRLDSLKLGLEWAKVCKWFGSSGVPGLPDAYAGVEWNELGIVVNETMDALGINLHVSRTEDQIRRDRKPYLGVVIQPHNKVRLIQRYLVPQVNESDPDDPEWPKLLCLFPEFWSEAQTYVYHASEELKTRPERAKPGAQTRKQHDDRVMAMLCGVYAAIDRFGAIRGINEYFETMQRAA